MLTKLVAGLVLLSAFIPGSAFGEDAVAPAQNAATVSNVAMLKPYRTFVTVQAYVMDSNGEPQNPISNVRLEIKFPGDQQFELPESGQYWPIGNGQKQEINRTYEVPWGALNGDGFGFSIQMVRKGSKMLPCNFQVHQLSQFNRTYYCHTDIQWQQDQKIPEEKLNKEGIQIRVFTDRNTPAKDLPKDALALAPKK